MVTKQAGSCPLTAEHLIMESWKRKQSFCPSILRLFSVLFFSKEFPCSAWSLLWPLISAELLLSPHPSSRSTWHVDYTVAICPLFSPVLLHLSLCCSLCFVPYAMLSLCVYLCRCVGVCVCVYLLWLKKVSFLSQYATSACCHLSTSNGCCQCGGL